MHEKKVTKDDDALKIFQRLKNRSVVIYLSLIGFFIYFYSLFNGFVWDDKTYILNNVGVHSLNIYNLFSFSLFNSIGQYRPIAALYFASLYVLFSNHSFFYHFFQIAIHITNSTLVFLLFRKYFNEKISLFLSLIFLVHPIQVESVSYIAASDNPLFFLFGISGVLLGLKSKISYRRLTILFCLLLLSLLTKETAFLFLFIIVIYRFIFKKNQKLLFIGLTAITTTIYFAIRFGIGRVYFAKLGLIPIAQLTLTERLLNTPAVIFYYLKTFFFPAQLAIDQQWTIRTITFNTFYFPLIVDIIFFFLVLVLGIYTYKTNKKNFSLFFFFFAWFIVGIGLHAQIFPLDETVSDRWFYFPMVGLLGMFAVFFQTIRFSPKKVLLASYIGGCILTVLSVRTIARNTNWSDAVTLYLHDMKIHNNYQLENSLGNEYAEIQRYDEALVHFQKSVTYLPFETNLYNVGYAYEQTDRPKAAESYYYRALNGYSEKSSYDVPHKHTVAIYIRLAALLVNRETPQLAIPFIKSALSDYPDSSSLWEALAIGYYKEHDQKNAFIAAKKALTLSQTNQTQYVYIQIKSNKPLTVVIDHNGHEATIKP